ncbi:hypothetical protein ACHAWU_007669 [Discostella pseudostelligera]|uniref:ACT domain-containing protein n=1 Tax=Discostella pseudostelligera TaxID=259834 RepID=A0ABD3M770_9STRA
MKPIGGWLIDSDVTAVVVSPTTRKFTSHPKKSIVINTVGVDRPGIVADVTRIVTAKGGNVGASQAQLLGGHFSLMMIVEIAASDMESLHEQLQTGVEGMSTSCFEAIDPKKVVLSPRIGFAGQFKLSGADNPGIVHKFTSVLARNNLTIGDMKTSHEEAPFGGTELFTKFQMIPKSLYVQVEGRAVAYEPLSFHFDWMKIADELKKLGESMNCDVEFQDVTRITTQK